MSKTGFSRERFETLPIVGIIRNISPEDVRRILPLYLEAGLTTVEITMNTPSAEELIRYARDRYGEALNIGAGTVCNTAGLEKALAAGATFIVTPIVEEQVISSCVQRHIPIFPGAYTPTEIYRAWSLGAEMVKVFPATRLGAEYFREVLAPLNELRLLPTGGVNIENCLDFLEAGACGLGLGSQLFHKAYIQARNWEALKAHFDNFAGKVRDFYADRNKQHAETL